MAKIKFRWPFTRTDSTSSAPVKEKVDVTTIPSSRVSKPVLEDTYTKLRSKTKFINPGWVAGYIPVIRKLSWVNGDMGQVVNDMVQLTNTGHRIKFDPAVKAEQQNQMRQHLETRQTEWGDGINGMNGFVNRLISQIWIGGALSAEPVVNRDKTGISNIALVNPETIVFSWNARKNRFHPYQKQTQKSGDHRGEIHKKLNTSTYKYYGLIGDSEIPYGVPPFLTALNPLAVQADMDKNIRFIIKQIGLLGFFELLMTKPHKGEGETDGQYKARLINLLDEAKENVLNGIQDGVVVGFDEDHEFKFNSTTKDLNGVSDLYNQNEQQVANGLKTAGQFLGVGGSSGAETGINIIFTKMLSQLTNVQDLIGAFLKHVYSLELRLAGFSFDGLRVEFNPSTITDELKFQQSLEYKIRNISNKYAMGIISQQQAADELGYDKPDQAEPRAPIEDNGAREKVEKDKDDGDRKSRDKSKPQPKRKDQKKNIDADLIDAVLDLINKIKE